MKRSRKSRDDPIVKDRKRIRKRSGATAPDLSRVVPSGTVKQGSDELFRCRQTVEACRAATIR
jgi:hypothetical protein